MLLVVGVSIEEEHHCLNFRRAMTKVKKRYTSYAQKVEILIPCEFVTTAVIERGMFNINSISLSTEDFSFTHIAI